MNIQEKESLYLRAKEAYYAGEPIMSDFEFDTLESELKDSGSSIIHKVGSTKCFLLERSVFMIMNNFLFLKFQNG